MEDYKYKIKWQDYHIDTYEGYDVRMTDYHRHSYYEVSLIYSGNVKVLLEGSGESGTECKLVLLHPGAAHYIACQSGAQYCRKNITFAPDYISAAFPQGQELLSVFGEKGVVVTLDKSDCDHLLTVYGLMEQEADRERFRYLLAYMLSMIVGLVDKERSCVTIPAYVTGALSYIATHFRESITAEALAWRLGIGRTTLMTHFKRDTGMTVKEYLTRCRLKQAVSCLRAGMTVQQAAGESGFADAGNLIYAFHRHFGVTPTRYISGLRES